MTSEQMGRLVRETWVGWAHEQPDPKPSWLVPWEELDDGQREVDMRIGETVAAAERERIRQLAISRSAFYQIPGDDGAPQPFADLIGGPDAEA